MIMRFNRLFAAAILAVSVAGGAYAQAGLNDPMTKAMMEIYDQEIAANPQAYDIYFRRANEYYKFDQYLRALSDIDNAIKYAPKDDNDLLFQCYSLRGDIYQMLGKFEEALADYTQALNIDPTSFMALYQKANTEYELGRYADAKADYNRMRANNARSAEALTGLARIAVKENNLGLASSYMDDAVSMMPADSDIYVRRSSVRQMLGDNTGAVDDLIMAISIDSAPKAFGKLVEISNEDYPAVVTALSNAVNQAPDQGMFYYIRGVIAQAHNHYPAAIADFQKIIDDNMYNYAGIYGSMAECYYALCDFDRALENINQAIGMGADNAPYKITLSKICRAQGRHQQALDAADAALEQMPRSQEAQMQKALCLYSLEKYDQASTIFGELIMDDPNAPMNYMMQAWVLEDGLSKKQNATAIYKRMLDIDSDWSKPASLRGFPLLFTNKTKEAIQWAEQIISENRDTDGSVNYLAACLYAQAGETEKAYECIENALNKGYANRYNLTMLDDARVNIAPLRKGNRLTQIMSNYSYIFE